ncbi:TRF2-interacting telomeric protein/Rap1 - C terminal domain containing protein [Naviculisporaceae sp. PSN 640]
MSAGITYEGFNGRYENTLFNGMKFFIHSQVPGRKWLDEKIRNNGGKLVLLEQHADIKLADPLFSSRIPKGQEFIDYKFVDRCVDEGTICNYKEFLIHAPSASASASSAARPGVSSTGPKTTRNPFTQAEDVILVKWVTQYGQGQKGNKIFQELVDKLVAENSRYKDTHTVQSWRDRWVKKFGTMSPANLQKYLDEPDDNPRGTQPARTQPVPRQGVPQRSASRQLDAPPPPAPLQAAPVQPVPRRSASQQSDAARPTTLPPPSLYEREAPKRRNKFTEAEDKMLIDYVAERVRADPNVKVLGLKIYKEFFESRPEAQTHSDQAWHDHYRLLERRGLTRTSRSATPAQSRPQNSPSEVIDLTEDDERQHLLPLVRRSGPRVAEDHLEIFQELELSQRPSGARTSESRSAPGPIILQVKDMTKEDRMLASRSVMAVQRLWRGYKVRHDLGLERARHRLPSPDEFEAFEDLEMPGERTGPSPMGPNAESESDNAVQSLDADLADEGAKGKRSEEETEFYGFLKMYQSRCEPPAHYKAVDIMVRGEKMDLPLWDLWRAADNQSPEYSLRDWNQIAKDLGFDSPVADQLKSAFKKHLRRFETNYRQFKAEQEINEEEEEEVEEDEEEKEEEEEGVEEDEDEEEMNDPSTQNHISHTRTQAPELSSLPPPVTGAKRPISQVERSPDAYMVDPIPKRRRYKSTDEIPCSPEIARRVPLMSAEPPEGSPQMLPLLPQETPKAAKVALPSIETDQRDPTPTQQLLSEFDIVRRSRVASESTASDVESEAFDPPVHPIPSRPSVAGRAPAVAQESRRRTLPKSWAKPADQLSSPRSSVPTTYRPAPPPPPKPTQPSRSVPTASRPAVSTYPPASQASASRAPSTLSSASASASASASNKPNQAMINEFISRGYDKDTVEEALDATTNDIELAEQVMQSISEDKGIPANKRGVWTSRDDRALARCHEVASGNARGDSEKARDAARERERLLEKHGFPKCRERARYLEKMPFM